MQTVGTQLANRDQTLPQAQRLPLQHQARDRHVRMGVVVLDVAPFECIGDVATTLADPQLGPDQRRDPVE